MNTKINLITGTGLPVKGNDIDTDRIMPARYLKELTFSNLGKYVFADEIKQAATDTPHPFADSKYQNANFLITNSNFGCGSSREHAPQGIKRWGIDCIIGESYSEIFFSNCSAIGLPCLVLDSTDIKEIQKTVSSNPVANFQLNLAENKLEIDGKSYNYKIDAGLKDSFISGEWDLTARLLVNTSEIKQKKVDLIYT